MNEHWHEELSKFEDHYDYDAGYLHQMIDEAPDAYEAYRGFQSMGTFAGKLPEAVRAVAKIGALRAEDCGPCLQLNVKMALEKEVDREVVRAAVNGGEGLGADLALVYAYARAVSANEAVADEALARIREAYGDHALAELALHIASARVYPAMKRAMGLAKSCSIVQIAV